MTVKKDTHAQAMRRQMTGNMYLIMALLQWNREEYCQFQYDCGIAYLWQYMNSSEPDIEIMERSAAFWGWWKLHWYNREDGILSAFFECKEYAQMTKHRFRAVYRIINNPKELARPETPQGEILDASFCSMLVPILSKY